MNMGLPVGLRAQLLRMMVEGWSVRSISSKTGATDYTLHKILKDAGRATLLYHDQCVRNLATARLNLNQVWSFGSVEKRAREERIEVQPDIWTWTATDADTKLVASWMIGPRSRETAVALSNDLRSRVCGALQMTTIGDKALLDGNEAAPSGDLARAQLAPDRGMPSGVKANTGTADIIRGAGTIIMGSDLERVRLRTAFQEGSCVWRRLKLRRLEDLGDKFAKKLENHVYATALYFAFYNFVHVHETLNTSPAIAAGISDKLWSMEDLATLCSPSPPDKRKTLHEGKTPTFDEF